MSIEKRKKITHCGVCKKIGHWHRECTNKGHGDEKAKNVILSIGQLSSDLRNKWLADSGASGHMSNDLKWFTEIKMFDSNHGVSLRNGSKVKINGRGVVRFKCKIKQDLMEEKLEDVAYIPSLSTNPISIGMATKAGHTAVFDYNHWKLMSNG